MAEDTKKYKVVGEEGASVEINGASHTVGAEVELTDEQATEAGANVELVKENE